MFIKNEMSCIEFRFKILLLTIYEGARGRGQVIEISLFLCNIKAAFF